jgi:predicted transcriptional regulator
VRREQLGLSRAALAAAAGCSLNYLQILEAGVIPRLSLVLPRIEATLDGLEAEQANHA